MVIREMPPADVSPVVQMTQRLLVRRNGGHTRSFFFSVASLHLFHLCLSLSVCCSLLFSFSLFFSGRHNGKEESNHAHRREGFRHAESLKCGHNLRPCRDEGQRDTKELSQIPTHTSTLMQTYTHLVASHTLTNMHMHTLRYYRNFCDRYQ